MFTPKAVFSGFSVDNAEKAKDFYVNTMGLELEDEKMGLQFKLAGGGMVFIYEKENHVPATYTVLNFVVDNIEEAVDELVAKGVKFEHYAMSGGPKTDEKGIARGKATNMGPDIAWFTDPAGNILSVLQN